MEAHSELTRPRDGRTPDKVALLERFRVQMLATARRYSTNSHDADDAYQRAAEILLTPSPTGTDDELCRWLRTTVKHEALAIRRQVERVAPAGEAQVLPEPRSARRETAHDEAERSERLSLGAQALGRLKPQEVRCLVLKAEGYSYQEICEQTGYSYTKVNRCMREGRRAFLARVASIESGAECDLVIPHLSALADGEGTAADLAAVRPHLKSCLACRARLREFRAVPARVAALAPAGLVAGAGGAGSAEPTARSFFESLLGSAQHKASALGDRAHHVLEMAGGQKAAAVAASAAALAGGGAVTAERFSERTGDGPSPAAEVRKAGQDLPSDGGAAEPVPPPVDTAPPSPTAAPTPPPPAPSPQPVAAAPPRPANEFAPEAAAASPPPAPTPASAPSEFTSGGGGPAGAGGGGPAGSGEFAP